jgi:hypothetical protein
MRRSGEQERGWLRVRPRQVRWAFGFAGLGASAESGRRPPPFLGGPIPLVRLGVDETGSNRVVNVSAKRLVGFSEEEISAPAAGARETIEDAGI